MHHMREEQCICQWSVRDHAVDRQQAEVRSWGVSLPHQAAMFPALP
jgi:hypothetical protein